jgi:hypothetical protein
LLIGADAFQRAYLEFAINWLSLSKHSQYSFGPLASRRVPFIFGYAAIGTLSTMRASVYWIPMEISANSGDKCVIPEIALEGGGSDPPTRAKTPHNR